MKLTSSNFAAAIGLNPYISRQKLWRVLTEREQRDPLNAAMQWGIDNEHRAVAGVEAHTGILFERTGKNQKHYTMQGYACVYGTTPDGMSKLTGLEVKCPSNIYDEIPAHYIPQIMGQIMIVGFESVLFSAWTPTEQRIWKVYADDAYSEWMLDHLEEFMAYWRNDEEPKRRKKPVQPDIQNERIL